MNENTEITLEKIADDSVENVAAPQNDAETFVQTEEETGEKDEVTV